MAVLMRARWHWEHAIGAMLCVLWLALAFHGAWVLSATMDEPPHIGDGLTVLTYGDYRMNPEHPPLFKVLAAIPPKFILDMRMRYSLDDRHLPAFFDPDQMVWGYYAIHLNTNTISSAGGNPQRVLLVARIMPILMGLVGGLVAWAWAAEFAGRRAGLFAMTLLLFYPEYLGHARFVTLDVPTLTACGLISLAAWRAWKRPTLRHLAGFVAASSVLALVKLPVIFFCVFQCLTILLLMMARRPRLAEWMKPAPRWTWRVVGGVATALLLSGYLMQWAGSGFRFSLISPDVEPPRRTPQYVDMNRLSDNAIGQAIRWVHARHLLPETALGTIAHVLSIEGRIMVLNGEARRTGWYSYFVYTILYKTPIVYLAGLLSLPIAGVLLGRRMLGRANGPRYSRLRLRAGAVVMLVLPFLLLFLLTSCGRLNIGHRHVLFVYLPWCVLLGVFADLSMRRFAPMRLVVPLAMLWVVGLTLYWQPNQATFFNTIGGGSALEGGRHLRDSNIDWGQDLARAGRELRRLGYTRANLAYFGAGRPESYGITDYVWLLDRYPFAVNMPEGRDPDPTLPTIVSLNAMQAVIMLFPGRFDRQPQSTVNSILIFPPESLP